MSATYNWAYKPGVVNKYGININSSDEDTRPSNAVYVALYGNDLTGNGSRHYPYRTIGHALSLYGVSTYILGSGTYREYILSGGGYGINFVGDGEVIFDIAYNGVMFAGAASLQSLSLYNIKIKGIGDSYLVAVNGNNNVIRDCVFDGAAPARMGLISAGDTTFQFVNTVFANYVGVFGYNLYNGLGGVNNCTFINMNVVQVGKYSASVFKNCNISINGIGAVGYPRYCLFFHCNFSFKCNSHS